MPEPDDSWERLLSEKLRALSDGRPAASPPGVASSEPSVHSAEARRFLEFAFRRKETTVPSGSRFERGKRFLLRGAQLFLRSQTEYNAAMVEALERVLRAAEDDRAALRQGAADAISRAESADRRAEDSTRRAEEAFVAVAAARDLAEDALRQLESERSAARLRETERSAAIAGIEAALAREGSAREELGRALAREQTAREELSAALGREESARDRGDAAIEASRLELSRKLDELVDAVTKRGPTLEALRKEIDRLRLAVAAAKESAPAAPSVEIASSGGAPTAPLAQPLDDTTYFEFEDEARGDEAEIRERQRSYVSFLADVSKATAARPVLDLGCGRGELLELLREAEVPARGVDSNALMVERCREKGLDVSRGDLFAILEALPQGSLSAVTAAQVVEHLPVAALVRLLALARRAVAPGGGLLLETINPESLYAMKFFWFDPTHVRPVPAPTLTALARGAGFSSIQVRMLSPVAAELRPDRSDESLARIDRALFGDQDYALFARVAS